MLQRLNELRRLPQILRLVTLTIQHTACQEVRRFGCGLRGPPREPVAIVDVAFASCVLICNTSSTFSLRELAFLDFRDFTFDFTCSTKHLFFRRTQFHEMHVGCKLPESVANFNARGLVCSPAVGKILGCCGKIIA